MYKHKKIAQTLTKLLQVCSIMLLLFFYVLASTNIESFHNLFHEHTQAELHRSNQEADPCHVSIYHQERLSACEHEYHIIKDDKCSLCDSQLHNTHVLFGFKIALTSFSAIAEHISIRPHLIESYFYYISGRAPPLA